MQWVEARASWNVLYPGAHQVTTYEDLPGREESFAFRQLADEIIVGYQSYYRTRDAEYLYTLRENLYKVGELIRSLKHEYVYDQVRDFLNEHGPALMAIPRIANPMKRLYQELESKQSFSVLQRPGNK